MVGMEIGVLGVPAPRVVIDRSVMMTNRWVVSKENAEIIMAVMAAIAVATPMPRHSLAIRGIRRGGVMTTIIPVDLAPLVW